MAPEEREPYLAEACGDDAELRLKVQWLLVDFEKDSLFGSADEGATIGAEEFDATCTEAEGDEIGPYTLRQQIGEGGFGTVWMAEQTGALTRMVALKVVKAGMDTKQVLAQQGRSASIEPWSGFSIPSASRRERAHSGYGACPVHLRCRRDRADSSEGIVVKAGLKGLRPAATTATVGIGVILPSLRAL